MTGEELSSQIFKIIKLLTGDSNGLNHTVQCVDQDKLSAFFDQIPHCIYLKDSKERYIYANLPTARLYNLTSAELKGHTAYELLNNKQESSSSRADDRNVIEKLQYILNPAQELTDYLGNWHCLKTIKVPVLLGDSKEIGLLGLSVDITQEKLLEKRLIEHNQQLEKKVIEKVAALEESEGRFRRMADNIQSVFWLSDAKLDKIIYVSPAYEKIWGKKAADLYNNSEEWNDSIHPEDRERVKADFLNNVLKGTFHCTYRIISGTGEVRWIEDHGFPVYDASKQIIEVAGVANDVTLRKQAEEVLGRNEKLTALGTFVAGVAHELNNPIGTILLASQHGSEKYRQVGNLAVANLLDHIAADAKRCQQIIQTVLDFSVNRPISRWVLDLKSLLIEYLSTLNIQKLTSRSCRINFSADTKMPKIRGNRYELERMVYNLVHNSIEAGASQVDIALLSINEQLHLSICDNGPGIPPEQVHKIFDPFYSTKAKGTGLGLNIVHQIVRAHHAEITVANRESGGLCVKVLFPVLNPQEEYEQNSYN